MLRHRRQARPRQLSCSCLYRWLRHRSFLTGDALFCQRPLARLIVEAGRAYLFAIKDNQPDLLETAQTAFADATPETADAATRGKKGAPC